MSRPKFRMLWWSLHASWSNQNQKWKIPIFFNPSHNYCSINKILSSRIDTLLNSLIINKNLIWFSCFSRICTPGVYDYIEVFVFKYSYWFVIQSENHASNKMETAGWCKICTHSRWIGLKSDPEFFLTFSVVDHIVNVFSFLVLTLDSWKNLQVMFK